MSKHTPTPWHVDGECIYGTTQRGDYVRIADTTVADGDNLPDKEADANASFIVRAVNCHDEMLKALKAVELGVFGSMLPNSDIDVCTRGTLAQVQAAIAKAEGK